MLHIGHHAFYESSDIWNAEIVHKNRALLGKFSVYVLIKVKKIPNSGVFTVYNRLIDWLISYNKIAH